MEIEKYTFNEINSDLRYVTIAQHLGGGVCIWFVNVHNLLPFTITLHYSMCKCMDVILHNYIDYILR